METVEYYGGLYPEAPEKKYKVVELYCDFKTKIEVPSDLDEDEIIDYVNELSESDLLYNADEIDIEIV